MSNTTLEDTARAMVSPGKGLFAADVYTSGAQNGFVEGFWGDMPSPNDDATARNFQEMLLRTPGLGEYISGIILFEDVLDQTSSDGTGFADLIERQGIMFGITPTTGWQLFGGAEREYFPLGIEGLPKRLRTWRNRGARFVKWRIPAIVGPGLPTERAIVSNARNVAEVAALAQAAGLVPIVEPEVEMKGDHDIARQYEVTEWFLHAVFDALYEHGVLLEGIVLKTNMVVSGSNCPDQADAQTVAQETIKCLRRTLPPAVPGVGFLSGGLSDVDSTAYLNAINAQGPQPWSLTFSYGRALGRAAMEQWDGKPNDSSGQPALAHRVRMNGLASTGEWSPDLEKEVNAAQAS